MGYRFATVAALVRGTRMHLPEAERIVDDWSPYVRSRMLRNESPESTAKHLARFETQKRTRRDPAPSQVSKRGYPFKVCPRGTRPEALMFPKELYDRSSARTWAKKHGFPIREIEETKNFIRIRVAPKELFVKGSLRNIPMSERYGVRMIIGCPRFKVLAGGRSRARAQERQRTAADY